MMQRFGFEHDGLTLSYLDTGGDRPLIVALHAMWMEARTFEDFATSMPEWRVVSMDQRGHGPNTELVSLEAGHVTHHDDPAGFVSNVRAFLLKLP